MVIVGDKIFIDIIVEATDERERHIRNKDIRESSFEERIACYNILSKTEIVSMLEKIGGFKK